MNRTIHTKYGNARISDGGYYRISSHKEGNYGKYLHKLIWEDYYGKKVPKNYVIHHMNMDKLDNNIWNLQCVNKNNHISFHASHPSEQTKINLSESKKGKKNPMYGISWDLEKQIKHSEKYNESGYFRVTKQKDGKYKQGYYFTYRWCENGKHKKLASVDIGELEKRVKYNGLPWVELGDN